MQRRSSLAEISGQSQPLYRVIVRRVTEEIRSGAMQPGDRLPGERDLSTHFGMSRVTVRRALAELRDRGLIEADSTRGWFVASPTVGEPNVLMSFSEMARSRGLIPSSRVRVSDVRPASIDEAEQLLIAPGAEVLELERIRLLDGVPVALERNRLALALAPDLPKCDFAANSLYDALRAAGSAPARSDYVLQAISADAVQAEALEVEVAAPLLMASARTFTETGRPVELSCSVYRGDRYRFRTTLFQAG
jgi:GntR family transcriptional regulator